jgi:hypothetical protein
VSLPEVGDVCMVVGQCGCAGGDQYLGQVFRVERLEGPSTNNCFWCGREFKNSVAAFVGGILAFHHTWLRKIDGQLPAEEQQRERKRVELGDEVPV